MCARLSLQLLQSRSTWRHELLYNTVEEQSRQSSFAALLCSHDCGTSLRAEHVVCSSHVLSRPGGFALTRQVLPLSLHLEQCLGSAGRLLPLDGRRQRQALFFL
jgi:hypothetical protein